MRCPRVEDNANEKISVLKHLIKCDREKSFETRRSVKFMNTAQLELNSPALPRVRKAPKKFESDNSPHTFNVEEYFRKIYFEIIDTVPKALNSRFNDEDRKFLRRIEKFIIGTGSNARAKEIASGIIEFYQEEFSQWDADRLVLRRNMALDAMKNEN